jgi:hypothetical protein
MMMMTMSKPSPENIAADELFGADGVVCALFKRLNINFTVDDMLRCFIGSDYLFQLLLLLMLV